jgi:hypothetical protein
VLPINHPAALLEAEWLRASRKPGFMNHSTGHAKVSSFLKIIADTIGFENMQAALDGAGDPQRHVTLARFCAENTAQAGSPERTVNGPC